MAHFISDLRLTPEKPRTGFVSAGPLAVRDRRRVPDPLWNYHACGETEGDQQLPALSTRASHGFVRAAMDELGRAKSLRPGGHPTRPELIHPVRELKLSYHSANLAVEEILCVATGG